MSPRAMTRYVFDELAYRATKVVRCTDCGRSVKRIKTFTETVNPWNVTDAGEPKTRSQVHDSIIAKAATWREAPETCTPCLRVGMRRAVGV